MSRLEAFPLLSLVPCWETRFSVNFVQVRILPGCHSLPARVFLTIAPSFDWFSTWVRRLLIKIFLISHDFCVVRSSIRLHWAQLCGLRSHQHIHLVARLSQRVQEVSVTCLVPWWADCGQAWLGPLLCTSGSYAWRCIWVVIANMVV